MFEKALITKIGVPGRGIDLGLLAETIFFYGSTKLLLNSSSLVQLAKSVPGELLALLDCGTVKLSYLKPGFAVSAGGPLQAMNFAAYEFGGTKEKPRVRNYREEIAIALTRKLDQSLATKKFIKELCDRTALFKFPKASTQTGDLVELARVDIRDAPFLRRAARIVLANLLPENAVPERFKFELVTLPDGSFLIDTDLNFDKLNSVYHKAVSPKHSSLSSNYLLVHILNARVDSFFAANYMAELVTVPIYGELIQIKHFDFLRARNESANAIESFRQVILPDFPSIREAINSGERSIGELLKLLEQAARFKTWLQQTNPDRGIMADYVRRATEKNWADKLPSKSVRFAIASGLGFAAEAIAPSGAGAVLGLGAGAIDSLYLDRLLKGWRPNQFIEGPFREFVSGKADSSTF